MSSSAIKIDKKIIAYSVVDDSEQSKNSEECQIEETPKITEWEKRPRCLTGAVYKIKDPGRDVNIYVTITENMGRIYEIFLNSSHTESHEYVAGLTRLISAMFREGMCPEFIAKEMKKVWSANGYYDDGKFRASVVSHIGDVILKHLKTMEEKQTTTKIVEKINSSNAGVKGAQCPKCTEFTLIRDGGCEQCTSCDYSKCG